MKTYYIAFETLDSKHWRIIKTNNDLDTSVGLQDEIIHLEQEVKKPIIVTYWKQLNRRRFWLF